jgi:hypothetical protein
MQAETPVHETTSRCAENNYKVYRGLEKTFYLQTLNILENILYQFTNNDRKSWFLKH